ncbi:MAG: cell division protein ZapE [Pseudomonadota bacterium]
MELKRRYQQLVESGEAIADPAQAQAVEALSDLTRRLLEREQAPATGPSVRRAFRALLGRSTDTPSGPVKGLYLWGGVGRGKTWLMDLFYECLPLEQRYRAHFHRFMYEVHNTLATLQDTRDPLKHVADQFAERARVLCFDELFVSDITDAMLLGTLFGELFERGVTLIATSNVPPSGLYANGLQRARFLPAIALLEEHTQVLNLDGGTDYRLRLLERAEIYHHPLDDQAEQNINRYFDSFCTDGQCHAGPLHIEGRSIEVRRAAEGVVWFDFYAICDGPRGQVDYIQIAQEFHTVMVSGVPVLTGLLENQARRFIALVDEFYDRNVKLILSAAAPLEELYVGERLTFEFERTRSRLLEMQSTEYLAQAHLP